MDKLENIIKLTEEELIQKHDKEVSNYCIGGDFYLKEYYRRQQDKLNNQMLKYTKWMTIMALITTIVAIINVAIFIIA